ncbi:hypothetical protein B0T20DRAFT_466214 [Sordaria brevicollis]|uniref:Uncharacterized protein n=1 Tax=Sordaria brevicollis TaxID=83679 RepID=A0AAE0UGL5_SORBR|nr:hypothetical protein B0T20DRAFT_466214 [Sordaria brevicollis]
MTTPFFHNRDRDVFDDPLLFPSHPPRWGQDDDSEDPIATYYLRTLNREIRALKSDYDLACCCHTYIKLSVLSLRLYLPVWEALLGEVLGEDSFGSGSEGEGKGEEEGGTEREEKERDLNRLDAYREVLEMMDMPEQDIPPHREILLPSNFWTARTYRSYALLHLALAETMLHLMSPGWRVGRVVVEWGVVGLFLQRCKREVRRIRQSVELNALVEGDVKVLEGWWVRSWWWMSWLSVWVDELVLGSRSGSGRERELQHVSGLYHRELTGLGPNPDVDAEEPGDRWYHLPERVPSEGDVVT